MLIDSTNQNKHRHHAAHFLTSTPFSFIITHTATHLGMLYVACNQEPLQRPSHHSLIGLLVRVCPFLNLTTNGDRHCGSTTLLVDDVAFKGIWLLDQTISSAGIKNDSILTVVAEELVWMRCHYMCTFQGHICYHRMERIPFEAGKRIGELRPTLEEFWILDATGKHLGEIRPAHRVVVVMDLWMPKNEYTNYQLFV